MLLLLLTMMSLSSLLSSSSSSSSLLLLLLMLLLVAVVTTHNTQPPWPLFGCSLAVRGCPLAPRVYLWLLSASLATAWPLPGRPGCSLAAPGPPPVQDNYRTTTGQLQDNLQDNYRTTYYYCRKG